MSKSGMFIYNSQIKKIEKELLDEQKTRIRDAATYLRKKVRSRLKKSNPSIPGQPPKVRSGNLKKGIRYEARPDFAYIGAKGPAHHAHLLEFGTQQRKTKDGKNTGTVEARPFLFPTFVEEKEAVKEKLAGTWVK